MAESDEFSSEQLMGEEERLRYIKFVHGAAAYMLVCAATLYAYAKEWMGPLKPGVETVEENFKVIVRPVYDKFHHVPLHILKFLDHMVSKFVQEIEKHIPSLMKEATHMARSVVEEVHRDGVVSLTVGLVCNAVSRIEPVAKDLYTKYEPKAEKYVVAAWRALNHLPFVPQVAHVVVPTVVNLSYMYNCVVCIGAEEGYKVATFLPLVPTEIIIRVFAVENDWIQKQMRTISDIDERFALLESSFEKRLAQLIDRMDKRTMQLDATIDKLLRIQRGKPVDLVAAGFRRSNKILNKDLLINLVDNSY